MCKHDARTHTLKEGILTGKSERVRCAKTAARYKNKTKNKIKIKIIIKRNEIKYKIKNKNEQNTHMRKHDTRTHTLKDGIPTGKSARVVRCAKAAVARYKNKE